MTHRDPAIGLYLGSATASLALILAFWSTGAIATGTAALLLVVPVVLAVNFVRAVRSAERPLGGDSPALRRYNKAILICSLLYMAGLFASLEVYEAQPARPVMFAAALLPTLPALGFVWAVFRYLGRERDEYLRLRAASAALAGLGAVLVIGTFYGFMETFGLVPHVWAWWVLPVWAIGMGLGQMVQQRGIAADADDDEERA